MERIVMYSPTGVRAHVKATSKDKLMAMGWSDERQSIGDTAETPTSAKTTPEEA